MHRFAILFASYSAARSLRDMPRRVGHGVDGVGAQGSAAGRGGPGPRGPAGPAPRRAVPLGPAAGPAGPAGRATTSKAQPWHWRCPGRAEPGPGRPGPAWGPCWGLHGGRRGWPSRWPSRSRHVTRLGNSTERPAGPRGRAGHVIKFYSARRVPRNLACKPHPMPA